MKPALLLIALVWSSSTLMAQITRPQVKSGFGVEAELESSLFVEENIGDDWFSANGIITGRQVIDTTGAASILQNYISNPLTLNKSFSRLMSEPIYSLIDNNRWIDAVFIRDFHGNDSTVFASGGNKNGQSPANWSTPVSQSVPDKSELLDVFMHVRRSGPSNTDSLWLFGGASIENSTGNRYFDFELYQTNIVYVRNNLSFTGYGPDAGHTSWKFDAAGNVLQPGDIILTAEYDNSSLTFIQARVWINKSDLSITPNNFNWSGQFDGAGASSTYGYASILPKASGAFYSGLQNENNVWGGPFKIALGNNDIVDSYTPRQFMEFSVNLTKLGLDPINLLGGNYCSQPFKKVMVKTRSSTSFTSALKDFVAPFDFVDHGGVNIFTDVPIFCGEISVSNIKITNPISTSTYTWSTIDGHFADSSNPLSVFVDQPGTYIVNQQLQSICPVFSSDTIVVTFDASCGVLTNEQLNFKARVISNNAILTWNVLPTAAVKSYTIERSLDGVHFIAFQTDAVLENMRMTELFSVNDALSGFNQTNIYYRLKINYQNNSFKYSNWLSIENPQAHKVHIVVMPNPVTSEINIVATAQQVGQMKVEIFNAVGMTVLMKNYSIVRGLNKTLLTGLQSLPRGIYTIRTSIDKNVFTRRLLFSKY